MLVAACRVQAGSTIFLERGVRMCQYSNINSILLLEFERFESKMNHPGQFLLGMPFVEGHSIYNTFQIPEFSWPGNIFRYIDLFTVWSNF